MNRYLKGVLALCTGFVCAVTAITIAEDQEPNGLPVGSKLGALDMAAFCRKEYGMQSTAIRIGGGAGDWRCWVQHNNVLERVEIDTDEACVTMYGPPAYSESFDPGSAFSWECFRGPRAAG